MPQKKNKMPAVLQQETPHTIRHHSTNPDAETAMDIDDQTHVNPADYPVPNTPPGQGEDQPQPQPQEFAYMSAKGAAQPADTQSEHQTSRSETADDRDEIIRVLRDEVDTLRRARQPKRTPSGGDSQLIERLSELFERSDSRDNYSEWRKNLLFDADYIGARDVLLRPNDVPKGTSLQSAHYTTSKKLLHTRILDCLTLDILHQVHTDHTQHPSEILLHLDTVYGVSPAEECLLLVKTLINLKPNGNTVAMMRQWQRITTEIERKGYDVSELCHDIGIILLGDFQRSFVRTQLDSLFAGSKRDRFHEMDMDNIIDQIESRKPDGFANLVHSTANANDWVLDTGATWTIYDDQSAFVNYMPLTTMSTVGLPDGSTHKVEGIGTIHLPIGEHMPYRFRITSPNGSAFLISRTVEDGMFDRLEAEKGIAYAVNDTKETNENKSRNLTPNRPPPAPIEYWHHRLSHMNQHDLQYLHRIGRINIQGKKLLPTCHFCRQAKTTRKVGNGLTPHATQPGRRLHVDIFGGGLTLGKPSDDDTPPANGKYKYAMILTDDAT
ncbi:hypothetical protein SI65_08607 [Aspergillus cristatus]|uniref:Retrovirus-related Pol polyprotein from transposon TNT 1-94-like beta-barrel domain-containing protein n=1 Tax=Aspergillus cristatus TaxID=573508 RepID=A0A1E3B5E5_ASPCR|nr:hypothetical protein SI65_08607 [Aspergillus cristatus]